MTDHHTTRPWTLSEAFAYLADNEEPLLTYSSLGWLYKLVAVGRREGQEGVYLTPYATDEEELQFVDLVTLYYKYDPPCGYPVSEIVER